MALGLGILSYAQDWKTDDQYIQNFAKYAVEEMEIYKIPASIKLAQGILETGGGQSRLAREGKNHFGIKCKENWAGKTMTHTDDAPNECFRVYNDPRESYRDHSLFLTTRKYYVGLFKLNMKDYRAWAHGLKKAGYATNPQYAQILINRIEKYKLYEFDNIKSDEVEAKLQQLYPGFNRNGQTTKPTEHPKENTSSEQSKIEVQSGVPLPTPTQTKVESKSAEITPMPKSEQKVEQPKVEDKTEPQPQTSTTQTAETETKIEKKENTNEENETNNEEENLSDPEVLYVRNHPNAGLKYIVLGRDTDLYFLSKKYGVRTSDLKSYNDLKTTDVKKNQIIFLESKKSYGNQETHKTRKGEKMYDISQKYGIKLSYLYLKNRMEEGEEPKEGQIIYLQKRKPRK